MEERAVHAVGHDPHTCGLHPVGGDDRLGLLVREDDDDARPAKDPAQHHRLVHLQQPAGGTRRPGIEVEVGDVGEASQPVRRPDRLGRERLRDVEVDDGATFEPEQAEWEFGDDHGVRHLDSGQPPHEGRILRFRLARAPVSTGQHLDRKAVPPESVANARDHVLQPTEGRRVARVTRTTCVSGVHRERQPGCRGWRGAAGGSRVPPPMSQHPPPPRGSRPGSW